MILCVAMWFLGNLRLLLKALGPTTDLRPDAALKLPTTAAGDYETDLPNWTKEAVGADLLANLEEPWKLWPKSGMLSEFLKGMDRSCTADFIVRSETPKSNGKTWPAHRNVFVSAPTMFSTGKWTMPPPEGRPLVCCHEPDRPQDREICCNSPAKWETLCHSLRANVVKVFHRPFWRRKSGPAVRTSE